MIFHQRPPEEQVHFLGGSREPIHVPQARMNSKQFKPRADGRFIRLLLQREKEELAVQSRTCWRCSIILLKCAYSTGRRGPRKRA